MNIYGIYDMRNEEQCLRVGPLNEVINFLQLTPIELGQGLKNNNIIRNQYRLLYLFNEEDTTEKIIVRV